MILFGSYASGTITKNSDVDLIIISPDFADIQFTKRSPFLYQLWHMDLNMNYPVDFVCYTTDEYNQLKNKISLVSQAVKEGMEI